jgi:hypothetical protein
MSASSRAGSGHGLRAWVAFADVVLLFLLIGVVS